MAFHRRAVACDLCGQQFFPSSLPFHMKSCVVKQQYVEVPCPNCDEPFRQYELQSHMLKGCKKKNSRLLRDSPPLVGGMSMCAVCGRKFAPDRLLKHQTICRRNSTSESSKVVVRDLNAAAEELAAPINSNWREKRDELKRRIGQSRLEKNLLKKSPAETSIEFQLVLKPSQKHREEEDTSPRAAVLDDSLELPEESVSDLNISISPPLASEEPPINPQSVNKWKTSQRHHLECQAGVASVSIMPPHRSPGDDIKPEGSELNRVQRTKKTDGIAEVSTDSLRELEGTAISRSKREPMAWTVAWPGTNEPISNRKARDPERIDPRARLEPVKFEFPKTLTRTTSSFTIPTSHQYSFPRDTNKTGWPVNVGISNENKFQANKYFPSASIRFN
jgi:hypothetical protein